MRQLEEEFRRATDRSRTLSNAGHRTSASPSYYENNENDILDCEWSENVGLRQLLLPLVSNDSSRFRDEIVKSNVAFRRSRRKSDIDIAAAISEASPFVRQIIHRVSPRLILLTGVAIDAFISGLKQTQPSLIECQREPRLNQVVFGATRATLPGLSEQTLIVQVSHASQFSWTYGKYGVSERILKLLEEGICSSTFHDADSGTEPLMARSGVDSKFSKQVMPNEGERLKEDLRTATSLQEMKDRWEILGIKKWFPKVHHFPSPKFSTKPSTLNVFYNWCVVREINSENIQTVNRAVEVAKLVESGLTFDLALEEAWKRHSILRR